MDSDLNNLTVHVADMYMLICAAELVSRTKQEASKGRIVQDRRNMGQAVDLEQAAYHAIPADEAPVLGHAPPASAEGKSEGEGRALLIAFVALFVLTMLTLGPFDYLKSANIPSFSVGLAGFDGIDPARPGPVVSPAFNLTLRMNKTCVDSRS